MGRRSLHLALPYVQHNSRAEVQAKAKARTKVLLKLPLLWVMLPLLLPSSFKNVLYLFLVRLIFMRPSLIESVLNPLEALGAHRTLLREGMRVEALGVRGWPLGIRVRLGASVARRPFLV